MFLVPISLFSGLLYKKCLEVSPCVPRSYSKILSKRETWASLTAQWLKIHLPMQGTRVRALVREDPTCHRATKPVRHNH